MLKRFLKIGPEDKSFIRRIKHEIMEAHDRTSNILSLQDVSLHFLTQSRTNENTNVLHIGLSHWCFQSMELDNVLGETEIK